MEKNPDISAPISRGDEVGSIKISLDGTEVKNVPLIALQDVAEGGWWEFIRDSILQWF